MASSSISADNNYYLRLVFQLCGLVNNVLPQVYLQMKLGWVVSLLCEGFIKVSFRCTLLPFFKTIFIFIIIFFRTVFIFILVFIIVFFKIVFLFITVFILLRISVCIGILVLWHICAAVAIKCLMPFTICTLSS